MSLSYPFVLTLQDWSVSDVRKLKCQPCVEVQHLGESLYAAVDKQKVVSNCWRALKPGGTIAIVEGLLPDSNIQSNDNRLIMGMQLDFALQGYNFMTKKEMKKLLEKFYKVRFEDLGGSVYLVTATK